MTLKARLIALALAALIAAACSQPADGAASGSSGGNFAEFAFAQTSPNLSGTTLGALGGSGASQTQTLSVREQAKTYFAVQKAAAAVITVSGADADKVTQYESGAVIDGIRASDTLAVFTADTGGESLLLDGGSLRFTLTVAEAGKTGAAVAVTLNVAPDTAYGVSVFFKDGDTGALTRITKANAREYANTHYAAHEDGAFAAEWSLNFEHVQSLSAALKWVDKYAQSGEAGAWQEYVIRAEHSEALPHIAVSCVVFPLSGTNRLVADWVKIRLRGLGRVAITPDTAIEAKEGASYAGSHSNPSGNLTGRGILGVGLNANVAYLSVTNHVSVQLEKNVLLDAANIKDDIALPYQSIVNVGYNGLFIMEPGSALANMDTSSWTADGNGFPAVKITSGQPGTFRMNGGVIENNKVGPLIGGGFAADPTKPGGTQNAVFEYKAGAFSGNKNIMVGSSMTNAKPYDDLGFRVTD